VLPHPIWWGLLLASVFYLGAHYSIVTGVWPIHGTSPGAGNTLIRDMAAFGGWLGVLLALRLLGYRGNWAVVALPVIIFFLTRPAQFQVFTDPVYQAVRGTRAEMNELKATRSRLSTLERAYDGERRQLVFGTAEPVLPDPVTQAVSAATRGQGATTRLLSLWTVLIAPITLLIGFLLARRGELLRWFREHKRIPFLPALAVFFVLTMFFTQLGKVGGFTPWELLLPLFIATWAATLADDAYNLARAGEVVAPRRLAGLFVYGALPVVPFLVIRELGLSIVLAGSMATMLLVGTRRGWWAGLMMAVWAVLVVIAFNVDDRSSTRLQLAYNPYRPLTGIEAEDNRWAAKLHQMKLFDASVLEGGIFGEGPGRGHGETAPNAADDGYVTLLAAQWGFAGTVGLVLLYTLFVVQMLGVAMRERGAFERTLVTGLAMLIGIPFWLATLGGIRIIPLTGVATAFAAHGGAKLLASALAVGVVAGISHRRAVEDRLASALAPPPSEAVPEHSGVRIR
jgi:cell division protein FtsW (lipid II flippase)